MTLGGVTRIVKKLEEQGLVARERCATDGRGHEAVLTDAGLARLQRAWPSHLASTRRHVFDKLASRDVPALTRSLTRLAQAD